MLNEPLSSMKNTALQVAANEADGYLKVGPETHSTCIRIRGARRLDNVVASAQDLNSSPTKSQNDSHDACVLLSMQQGHQLSYDSSPNLKFGSYRV